MLCHGTMFPSILLDLRFISDIVRFGFSISCFEMGTIPFGRCTRQCFNHRSSQKPQQNEFHGKYFQGIYGSLTLFRNAFCCCSRLDLPQRKSQYDWKAVIPGLSTFLIYIFVPRLLHLNYFVMQMGRVSYLFWVKHSIIYIKNSFFLFSDCKLIIGKFCQNQMKTLEDI